MRLYGQSEHGRVRPGQLVAGAVRAHARLLFAQSAKATIAVGGGSAQRQASRRARDIRFAVVSIGFYVAFLVLTLPLVLYVWLDDSASDEDNGEQPTLPFHALESIYAINFALTCPLCIAFNSQLRNFAMLDDMVRSTSSSSSAAAAAKDSRSIRSLT